ncbi:MAG: hypothetical protein M1829_005590 [Trizodia sp. TS-e1964]|nr:MAG: hypothetical protein M1829_005590 [Trizodia sp. TS-e1964]
MAASIPSFESTALESIPSIANTLRSSFHSHKTRPLEFRLLQLRKLYWGLKDNEPLLSAALAQDLGKPVFEAFLTEITWCENDILFVCKNLAKWTRDEKAPDIPLMNLAFSPKIRKDPLGCVLVIGAFNYPLQLSLGPFIGAIAAGNTAVLKPSEVSPATAMVMGNIVRDYLDPAAYTVVQGGIPETTALLNEKWDKIFYTGNAVVGTIIAKKAAESLTPLTLELGGRNPAIISRNADPRLAARRLLWGKVHNAGQVCVSENYILVDNEIFPAFLAELRVALKDFFPKGVENSSDFGRIVNQRHFRRIRALLDASNGKILIGGHMDEETRYIEPTVIQVNDLDDSLIKDEIFGPLLPIYVVNDLDEAIKIANDVSVTPLAVYAFGKKAETDKVLRETRSGGASVNDSFCHASLPTLAFGGIGESGSGAYRGKQSFDVFTHRRSFTTTPSWFESLLSIRYPPYDGKLKKFLKMAGEKPNFDREGRVKKNLIWTILTLGSNGSSGAATKWGTVVLGKPSDVQVPPK